MRYNIYSGYKGKETYQETEEFETEEQAIQYAADITFLDSEGLGISLYKLDYYVVETEADNIPADKLVGSLYF